VGGFWLTQGPYPTPPPNQIKEKKEKKWVEKTENLKTGQLKSDKSAAGCQTLGVEAERRLLTCPAQFGTRRNRGPHSITRATPEAPPRSLLPLLPPPVAAATAGSADLALALSSLSRKHQAVLQLRAFRFFSHSSLLFFPRFRFYAPPTSHKPRTPVYFVYVFLCGRLL
jgi:hypothetical protein